LHFASLPNPNKAGETISNPINTTPVTVDVTSQKADLVAVYEALIDGIKTLLVGVDPIVLGTTAPSVSMTQASILAQLQQRVDAANATKAARKALASLVAAERGLDVQVRPLRAALKRFLVARLGPNSPELQKFGFTQNRRPRKTAQSKAQAASKATATRAKRSTQGRQQKAAPTAVAPVQATAPSPAPAAAPVTPPHGNGTPS
jgi:hypothetical protein